VAAAVKWQLAPPPIGGAERAGDTRGGAGGAAGRQVRHSGRHRCGRGSGRWAAGCSRQA